MCKQPTNETWLDWPEDIASGNKQRILLLRMHAMLGVLLSLFRSYGV